MAARCPASSSRSSRPPGRRGITGSCGTSADLQTCSARGLRCSVGVLYEPHKGLDCRVDGSQLRLAETVEPFGKPRCPQRTHGPKRSITVRCNDQPDTPPVDGILFPA